MENLSDNGLAKDPQKIKEMFAQVAAQYDRANNILSGGIHHLWRKKLVQISGADHCDDVLDCATGTGDLAIEFKRKVGADGRVTGTDFCPEMLSSAPAKAQALGLDVNFQIADVMDLPFPDHSFDIVSISFGIRNVKDAEKALKEMARVTRPGGRVMVLEFGQVRTPILAQIYQFYSQSLLPKIGGWITGQKNAYEYLQKSSAQFPCREDFVNLMNKTGAFTDCDCFPVTGGIAYIYRGIKNHN